MRSRKNRRYRSTGHRNGIYQEATGKTPFRKWRLWTSLPYYHVGRGRRPPQKPKAKK